MNQPNKERFKTSVGGQALMEGIMMRGPKLICCAVRKPDGTIETKTEPTPTHGIWTKIPLVRGAISMIESLIMGYRYMMYSAQVSMGDDYDPEEEETAFEKWVGEHLGKKAEDALLACAAVLGGLLAILLFTVLPTLIVGGVNHFVTLGRWAKVMLEAVLKVGIFLTYMVGISKMKEIHRVFEYHGAEHKTIACYEAGDPLTVENVRKYTRFHPRPGHQPEKFCGVVIRIRASGRRQTGFQLPHRVPRGHACRYHLPSSGFSGSTGVTAAMATSIMLSSGSNTVRCCTQMPG